MSKNNIWSKDFFLLAFANLLMAIAFYFMLPILPVYLVDKLGATRGEIGIILSFYTIAALVIRLFSGWAIDTYGRKLIYLFAYLFFSIFFIGYPIASSVLVFLLIRFAHGLTWGVLTTSSSTIAVDLIPSTRRGEGIGIFGLSMTIGMAIGPMIAILIAGESRYFALFLSAIGFSLLGLALALIVRYPIFSTANSNRVFSFRGLIEKSAIPMSINMMLIMFSYGGVLSFISLYGKEIGVNNSGIFFLILSIGIGLSRIGSGRIIDRQGPAKISIIGLLALIIGFPILALIKNPIGYHIAAAILGLGFGIIMPTFQTMVNNLVPANRRGAANSSFFTAFDLGIGLGMMGTGLLSQWLGFSSTFLICSVVNLFALNFFLIYSINHYNSSNNKV
jgi:predicted MFS family arabinose efflux permease